MTTKPPIFARVSFETLVDTAWDPEFHKSWWEPTSEHVWISRYRWLALFMWRWRQGWLAGGIPPCVSLAGERVYRTNERDF